MERESNTSDLTAVDENTKNMQLIIWQDIIMWKSSKKYSMQNMSYDKYKDEIINPTCPVLNIL